MANVENEQIAHKINETRKYCLQYGFGVQVLQLESCYMFLPIELLLAFFFVHDVDATH